MRVEEVDREDEAHRQERLVAVDDDRHVEHPSGQNAGEECRVPQEEPAAPDDRDAPEHRPVVELLPVGPAVEGRPRPVTGPRRAWDSPWPQPVCAYLSGRPVRASPRKLTMTIPCRMRW